MAIKCGLPFLIPIGLLLTVTQIRGFPNGADEATFERRRLGPLVKPSHYNIHLDLVDGESASSEENPTKLVKGSVDIHLSVSQSAPPLVDKRSPRGSSLERILKLTCMSLGCARDSSSGGRKGKKKPSHGLDRIFVHVDKEVGIESITYFRDSMKQNEVEIQGLEFDRTKQMLAIDFVDPLESGSFGILSFTFKTKPRDDLRGMHSIRSKSGQTLLTKFQPSDARLFLPCFDDPRFRANIFLTIKHRKDQDVLSHEEGERDDVDAGYVTTTFKSDEKMPIHMFAFAVGRFDHIENTDVGRKRIRVGAYTSPGLQSKATFALETAAKTIEWIETYMNSDFPFSKFDILCVLDHESDNTENWGLATIRSRNCLFDEDTLPSTKIKIAINVAHVVAHQWFGNKVSVEWWDDLWITEGAAAFLAFKMVDEVYPNFDSDYFIQFNVLSLDILNDMRQSKPHSISTVQGDLASSEDVRDLFDSVTFTKSGSLFKLFEKTLGEEKFQTLLRRFQFYCTIERSHFFMVMYTTVYGAHETARDVFRFNLDTFYIPTYEPKVPIVSCTVEEIEGEILLKLDMTEIPRVLEASHEIPETLLPEVKVDYYDTTNELKAESWRNFLVLDPSRSGQPRWFEWDKSDHFLMLDLELDLSHYFTIDIDEELDANFKRAIGSSLTSSMSRALLLDHMLRNFVVRGIELDRFERWLTFYEGEEELLVILQVLKAMQALADRKPNSRVFKTLLDKIETIFSPNGAFFPSLGQPNGFERKDYRFIGEICQTTALTMLVKAGNQEAIQQALQLFRQSSGDIPEVFLRLPVYTAVVKEGKKEEIDLLFKKLQNTKSLYERIQLAGALVASEDKRVKDRLLKLAQSILELPIESIKNLITMRSSGLAGRS